MRDTLLMALVGLFFGVKMPTLTWTGEIMPIKQGAPVMITLFCGFGYREILVGFFGMALSFSTLYEIGILASRRFASEKTMRSRLR